MQSPETRKPGQPSWAGSFIVIVDENKDYGQVINPSTAPNIAALAKTYGVASNFFAEVHPSEPNYVALLGGDTYGIHDDDAFYCVANMKDRHCEKSSLPGYVDHTVSAEHLGMQLDHAGLSWKGYYESLPAPGSTAIVAGDPKFGAQAGSWELYASKHSGFMNFASAQQKSIRSSHIVGFGDLSADLSSGRLPAFALVVPNQCNDMHGLDPTDYSGAAAHVPDDCNHKNVAGLIRRGDTELGRYARIAIIRCCARWGTRSASITTWVTPPTRTKAYDQWCRSFKKAAHSPIVIVALQHERYMNTRRFMAV